MEQIPWWKSQTLRALIIAGLAQVIQMLGLTDTVTSDILTLRVDQILDIISLIATGYAGYARTTKANPPLTASAAKKEVVVQAEHKADRQGGYVRVAMVIGLALLAGTLLVSMSGCAGTLSAYKAARGDPEKTAYVALEHYESLQSEAIRIKAKPGTSADVIDAMKKADAAAFPIAEKVRDLQVAYRALKDSGNAEALQAAVDNLVLLLADMVTANKRGRT